MAEGGQVNYCEHGIAHDSECEYFADGGEVENNIQFIQNPDLAIDHAVASHGLHHLMTKTGKAKESDPSRGAEDFIRHSRRGQKLVHSHFQSLFDKKKEAGGVDVENIKNHLQEIRENPHKINEIGGDLSSVMPDHAAIIAAKAANATNFLDQQQPMGAQRSPLDKVLPPNKMQKAAYDRKLQIAENPLSIISRIKNGTIQPDDLMTLDSIYPKLGQKIREKATEILANTNADESKISYKHRQGLSLLLGEPLDSTMTMQSMQAIIQSQAPKTPPPSAPGQNKKASGVELKQINEVNKLSETPLQARQIDKKS